MKTEKTDLKDILNGSHWVFLCFTPDRMEKLATMHLELIAKHNLPKRLTRAVFPAGVLWNGEPCVMVAIAKADLPRDILVGGLREHLGYETPEAGSDVFTLGVMPEDDEAFARVGLFGEGGK